MIQRLLETCSAVADVNGNATFAFAPTPAGLVWTGTVGVNLAPATAAFTARVGIASAGDPWGSWSGNGTFGPVQAWAPLRLVVEASGLTPGTTYYARWIGDSRSDWEAAFVSPSALTTAIAATAPFAATGGTITTAGGYTIHTFTVSGTFTVLTGSASLE